jgi:hypothetical protein
LSDTSSVTDVFEVFENEASWNIFFNDPLDKQSKLAFQVADLTSEEKEKSQNLVHMIRDLANKAYREGVIYGSMLFRPDGIA